MKKFLSLLVVGILVVGTQIVCSSKAEADIVSGIHFTEGGKAVDLQGLEWLTLDVTVGHSRMDIENGALGLLAAGWRYASREETSILLKSLWGGVHSGGHETNTDGAYWFYQNIGRGGINSGFESRLSKFFYGQEGECSPNLDEGCLGFAKVAFTNDYTPVTGWFYDIYGLDATILNPVIISDGEALWKEMGSLLVRGTSDPDTDGDGILDSIDNCIDISNPSQADFDDDGIGNDCDFDDDNDGYLDDSDNCQYDYNPNQEDYDNDGAGDVCDADADGDGVIDADDECLETSQNDPVDAKGCSVEQICPCQNDWKNHGAYVVCFNKSSKEFLAVGLIDDVTHGEIVSNAADSNCGQ